MWGLVYVVPDPTDKSIDGSSFTLGMPMDRLSTKTNRLNAS